MNKSDIAFKVTQDIYALAGTIDRLNEQYDNRHISEQVYYKKLYVHACEAAYLGGVVEALMERGYKFARYTKELAILSDAADQIGSNLDIRNMNEVNFYDMKNLKALMKKYESVIPVEDIDEDSEELSLES